MKFLSLFAISFVFILETISSKEHSQKPKTGVFDLLKNSIAAKFEEYQEKYDAFLYLMSTMKQVFYDDYYSKPKGEYKLVHRETKKPRDLQSKPLANQTVVIDPVYNCNDVGRQLNTTETNYYCFGAQVSLEDYNKLSVNNTKNCTKNDSPITLCYCPKDYYGSVCENKRKTVCKFKSFSVNGQDLLKNYNTFYDEYLNNTFSTDFDKNTQLNYKATLKCVTPNSINETHYYNNSRTTLKVNPNSKNITLSREPKLQFVYRLYDMRSLLPAIQAYMPFNSSIYKQVLSGELKFPVII